MTLTPTPTTSTMRPVGPVSKPPSIQAHEVIKSRVLRRGRHQLLRFNTAGWCVADGAIALGAIALGYSLSPITANLTAHVQLSHCALTFAVLLMAIAHVALLHDSRRRANAIDLALRCAVVATAAIGLLTLGWTVASYLKIGRYIIVIAGVTTTIGMITTRLVSWKWCSRFEPTTHFLGGAQFHASAAQFLKDQVNSLHSQSNTGQVGDEADLEEWVIQHNVDELVYDSTANVENRHGLLACLDAGVRVLSYSDFIEENYCRVPIAQVNTGWLFSARLDSAHPYYLGLKRLQDVVVSVVGLIVTFPLLVLAAVAIKIESKGPILYTQQRVGRFNKVFRIYKLRSMKVDSESEGARWASCNDDRVTRVGKILRRTRIDEFPQFWNVLKGEMSLIGPRPERPEFVEILGRDIPFYLQRHLAKPGLTGWAQINYPYGASVDDSYNKLTYDFYYIKNASFGLDLQIFLRTLGAMMSGSR